MRLLITELFVNIIKECIFPSPTSFLMHIIIIIVAFVMLNVVIIFSQSS